jgi:uncharacterized protein
LTPFDAPLTPLTRAGRFVSKSLTKLLDPESAFQFQVSSHTLFVPNLPEAFESLRIVHLTDIHYYEFSNAIYHQRVIDTVNSLKPDLIVTTGDIIHYGQQYLAMGESFLRQLKAPLGKWACMGNHDYSDDFRGAALRHMKASAGFKMLVNDAAPLEKDGQRLWISGIDDYKMSTPDPEQAYQDVEKDACHLTLLHNPAYTPNLIHRKNAPNVILSGHTHGGQIKHPVVSWLQRHVFHHPYQYGWFDFGHTKLYVSSGIGSASVAIHGPHFDFSLYPFRINTTPEIVVLELTNQPLEKKLIEAEQAAVYAL